MDLVETLNILKHIDYEATHEYHNSIKPIKDKYIENIINNLIKYNISRDNLYTDLDNSLNNMFNEVIHAFIEDLIN